MARIKIGNLPYSVSLGDVSRLAAKTRSDAKAPGVIMGVVLPMDDEEARPKGHAFVVCSCDDLADALCEMIDGVTFKGRTLTAKYAPCGTD